MNTTTINISLPKNLLNEVKKSVATRGYSSISEFFREVARNEIYKQQGLTENGFTPEVEDEILKAASEPHDNDVEWDGKTPYDEFMRKLISR